MPKNSIDTERTFSATIIASSKELSAYEKVKYKDTRNAIKLDEATHENPLRIAPKEWVTLNIHNEASQDKDYMNFLVVDSEGKKYVTGSTSFVNSFMDIWNELAEMVANGEAFEIEIYQTPSKNYANKSFITCSLV